MATELPVRIEFSLPEGWESVPPNSVGAVLAAFVAVHPASVDRFTANITITGQIRPPEQTMIEIADESVSRLEGADVPVSVRKRVEAGSPESPGLSQVLDLGATVHSQSMELVQCQGFVSMVDVDDPDKRAVIELVLTCRPSQLETVFPDFQDFVRSVRPAGSSVA
ncbi:hypothetical protein EV193_115121 [Herbihabitans rhizosphaerae]|uniref:Lipoprotein LpqN n=1 Tax=Herbihabitans rhizosphaerae TaxID=1872711 RepID=A0A4Q7KGF5_9PSEU|nr:hypothetical protein [Herbihabitans rhizosphaerae]RZS31242.1 hypothetical protein EV193_115121 [Herbihabitans rhizosphaerae]